MIYSNHFSGVVLYCEASINVQNEINEAFIPSSFETNGLNIAYNIDWIYTTITWSMHDYQTFIFSAAKFLVWLIHCNQWW